MDFLHKKEQQQEINFSKIKFTGDSFLFIGCWNNEYCKNNKIITDESNENDLYKTVQSMKHFLRYSHENNMTKPQKLIIAGDNYYPDKVVVNGEKEKNTNITNLQSGFECLHAINIDKYILFGNHDLEKTTIKDNTNIEDCYNLKYQLEYTKNEANMEFFDFKSYYLPHIFTNETLIVMIDSTMYDIKDDDKSVDCYELINENNKNNDNSNMLDFIKTKQTKRANNLIDYYKNENIKNIIFIAHHPIFGLKLKEKNGKKEKRVDCYEGLVELELLFYEAFKTKENPINYYHFCADIHQFQVSTITINTYFIIKQYIVGTGGAEKDEKIDNAIIAENKGIYNITSTPVISLDVNGFMNFYFDNHNNVKCSFFPNFVFDDNKFNKQTYDLLMKLDFFTNKKAVEILNKAHLNKGGIKKSRKNKIKSFKKNINHKKITKRKYKTNAK